MTAQAFSAEQLREFVIAGHSNLPKVREMLAQFPELLNVPYQWGENDYETAVQAAAHVGSTPVAEYLLSQGAPLEICTAAILARRADVERLLAENPALIDARGAHQIPLMAHAAWSGDVELMHALFERGAREGMSFAFGNAVSSGRLELARWLLENAHPDLKWTNFEGKSALTIATERKDEPMIALLHEHGAA